MLGLESRELASSRMATDFALVVYKSDARSVCLRPRGVKLRDLVRLRVDLDGAGRAACLDLALHPKLVRHWDQGLWANQLGRALLLLNVPPVDHPSILELTEDMVQWTPGKATFLSAASPFEQKLGACKVAFRPLAEDQWTHLSIELLDERECPHCRALSPARLPACQACGKPLGTVKEKKGLFGLPWGKR